MIQNWVLRNIELGGVKNGIREKEEKKKTKKEKDV